MLTCTKIMILAPSFIISQTLLFLRPQTLSGEKLDVYCLGKMLKYFTGADVTSYKVKYKSECFMYNSICDPFQLKWALNDKLLVASPADVGGIGAALRLVLTHTGLRDKFTGVTRELEEAGYRSIQVTDTGFRLIRK